jgi:hypothetical protein
MSVESSGRLSDIALRASAPTLTKVASTSSMILLAAYCVVFVLLSPVPVQDFPNHLARAVAMSDILFHGGNRFGDLYQFHVLWVPYLLSDLVLAAAITVFGTTLGGALWTVLVFASFPCAGLLYLRARGIRGDDRLLMLLVGLYLATDWFFLMGFWAFQISISMFIATLALVELLRRKWSTTVFALYVGAVALDYLMHLSPIVFLVAALGSTGLLRLWLRTTNWRTEIMLFVPVIGALAWHFGVASSYREAGDAITSAYYWGTWTGKFARIGSQFFHYAKSTDLVLVALLTVTLLLRVGLPRWRAIRQPLVLEMLLLTATFLAMYFVLPLGYAEAYYVDTRPLPLVSFFFIVACMAMPRPDPVSRPGRIQLALFMAALLALGNFAYIARHFLADRAWTSEYRSLAAAVPLGGRVLTVYTHGGQGSFNPYFHTSGFVVIDRVATEPYVFAGDNGNPMKYFRYKHLPYNPPEDWYGRLPRPALDWKRVARDYDYILVTRPYDAGVFGLPIRPLTENATGTLYQIEK